MKSGLMGRVVEGSSKRAASVSAARSPLEAMQHLGKLGRKMKGTYIEMAVILGRGVTVKISALDGSG